MELELELELDNVINYAQSLVGIKYVWWLGDAILGEDCGPFWSASGPPPDAEKIKLQGVCCTGVFNLIRRYCNLPVPGVLERNLYAGGTKAWADYFEGYWQPFNREKPYPQGTIFFRPYHSFADQGHIAMLLNDKLLLHSYPYELDPVPGFHEPGCTVDKWIDEGYYEYTLDSDIWLHN